MKPRKVALFAILLSLIVGCYFYYNRESPSEHFDQHIMDAIHLPTPNAFFEQADAYKYAQDYRRALTAFEKLLPLSKTAADSLYTYNQLAYIALATNEDSAAAQYIQALEAHFPLVDKSTPSVSGDYFYNRGVLAYRVFHPKEAESLLKRALGLYEKVYGEEHLKVAMCLTELGMVNFEFSTTLDSAFFYIDKAGDIFKVNINFKKFSQETELGMAFISFAKRSHEAGQLHCEIALNLAYDKPYIDTIFIGRCLSMKGNMLKKRAYNEDDLMKKKQLFSEADSCYFKAIKLVENKLTIRTQEFYRDYIISKSREKDSIEVFRNIAVLEKLLLNQPDIFAQPDRLKGKYYFLIENHEKSAIWYQKFWERYRTDSLKNALLMGEINYCLIESYIKLKKHDQALYFLKKDLTLGTKYENDNLEWSTLLTPTFYKEKLYQFVIFGEAGKIFLSKYKTTHQVKDLQSALKVLELTDELLFRGILTADDDAILTYQKEVANVIYPLALDVVFELSKIKPNTSTYDLAFRYTERVKSFLLYRDLVQDKMASNIPSNMADTIKIISSKINRLKWENQRNGLNMIELGNLSDLQKQLDEYYDVIKQKYPNYYKLKIAQPIPSIKEVMNVLKPNQALIQYSFHKDKLYALLIANGQVDFHCLDSTARLIRNINDYLTYLQKPSNDPIHKKNIIQIAQQLYEDLLGYTPQLKTMTDLLIIPDKILNNLPFEALIEPNKNNNNSFQNAAFFQKRMNITYTPSWKIYENNYNYSIPLKPTILAMTYGETSAKGFLPKAMDEIKVLKFHFKDNLPKVLTHQNCSKENFLIQFKSYDIIHLSLHAQSNLTDRRDNKIYFKLPISDELYGFELLNQQTKTCLVVLSACETAIGKTETGEGTYSLSRAFLQSGVKNVISSLWKIDDYVAAQLFNNFYSELSKNQKPYLALNSAKRHFLLENKSDELMSNPSYWAGLMILD